MSASPQLPGADRPAQHAVTALALASVGLSFVAVGNLVRVVPPAVALPANVPVAGLLAGTAFGAAALAQSLVALRARRDARLVLVAALLGLAATAAGLLPLLLGGAVRV